MIFCNFFFHIYFLSSSSNLDLCFLLLGEA
nr:MAG TPA: LytB-sulfur-cluster binding, oxidoreductase [Caudoviricetes sp.]